MDHHCPWVNNCVAIFNQKYFILFLFYTSTSSIYCAALLIAKFFSCTSQMRKCDVSGAGLAFSILTFIEALIFGLFTIIMMFDQLSAIFDNTPGIDAIQQRRGVRKPRYQSLIDVFGERFSWRWFLPLNLPAKMRQDFEMELKRSQQHQQQWYLDREKERLRAERTRAQEGPTLVNAPAEGTDPNRPTFLPARNGAPSVAEDEGGQVLRYGVDMERIENSSASDSDHDE